jgi:hypothetical protein
MSFIGSIVCLRTHIPIGISFRGVWECGAEEAPLGFRFEDGRLVEDPAERATLARVRDMKRRGTKSFLPPPLTGLGAADDARRPFQR